jgi:shikimate kinase
MLFERIKADKANDRPLARNRDEFMRLMESRREHYESFSLQIKIDGKSPEKIVDKILSLSLLTPSPDSLSP